MQSTAVEHCNYHWPDLLKDLGFCKAAPKSIARAANPKLKPLFSSKVGLLAAYKLNKIPWPQKAEVATAPAPPPKDYRWEKSELCLLKSKL